MIAALLHVVRQVLATACHWGPVPEPQASVSSAVYLYRSYPANLGGLHWQRCAVSFRASFNGCSKLLCILPLPWNPDSIYKQMPPSCQGSEQPFLPCLCTCGLHMCIHSFTQHRVMISLGYKRNKSNRVLTTCWNSPF